MILRLTIFGLSATCIVRARDLRDDTLPSSTTIRSSLVYVIAWAAVTMVYCLLYFPILYSRPGIDPFSHRSPSFRGSVVFLDGFTFAFQAMTVAVVWQLHYLSLDKTITKDHLSTSVDLFQSKSNMLARLQTVAAVLWIMALAVTVLLSNQKARNHLFLRSQ
jgi:hypothetical protein